MSKITALRAPASPPPPPVAMTPERAKLAEAITERDEFDAQLAATRAAEQVARAGLYAASAAVAAAQEAAAEAEAAITRHLIAVARGTADVPPVTIDEAGQALAAAERRRNAARAAHAALSAELAAIEQRAATSASYGPADRVQQAALAVLGTAPAIGRLVADQAARHRDLIEGAAAIEWLRSKDLLHLGTRDDYGGWRDVMPAKLVSDRYYSPPKSWAELVTTAGVAGVARWSAALDALQRDAMAPLPG